MRCETGASRDTSLPRSITVWDTPSVRFRFIGQPFPEHDQIGLLIGAALRDETSTKAWFATAWAKRSGLGRLATDLTQFRARGGHAEVLVGVDEGGATIEGLQMAIDLFDEAHVFHDPGGRTFHPKIYVVEGPVQATAIVGSGNLTRGGLFTNYEGAVVADLDLSVDEDARYLSEIHAYYDRLRAADKACKPLTVGLIEDLKKDSKIVVTAEARQKRGGRGRDSGKSELFGKTAVQGLLSAPSLPAAGAPEADDDAGDDFGTGALAVPVGVALGSTGGGQETQPELRWWKKLTISDAHRKPPPSHQRNYVALTKAHFDIDWRRWFRDELLGALGWSTERMRSGKTKEVTVARFEVYVDGKHLGHKNLRFDHAPHRIADQNNAPTYLNWSSMLMVIESRDFTGWWLELASLGDGTYRLQLLRDEPS